MQETPEVERAAVVTGGSRGIGAAICRALAADGWGVLVGYADRADRAHEVVAAVTAAGGRAVAQGGDVSDPAVVRRLFATARAELGPVRAVVNNAGSAGTPGPFDGQSDADLRRLLEVNVLGVMLCCREAISVMSTAHGGEGGAIVNVASVAARTGGLPGLAAYAATKGAVVSLSRGLSNEVAGVGIRVNSISPGSVRTDMTTPAGERAAAGSPIGRIGTPDEIAAAVAWLVSPAASFVTGTDLAVTGGR